jgi:ABC-type glycerol-3-phosphate transport system substrate-binding protein
MENQLSRRLFLKWAGVGAAGMALVACAPAAAPQAAPAEEEAKEPAAPASQPGAITGWSMSFPPHQWMMTEAIQRYNQQKPDVTIDYQPQPGDYGAKWRAALAANQAPDLFVIHGTALLELVLGKQILPLTPDVLTVEEARTNFMPEYYLQSFYEGNLYALGVPDPPGDAGLVVNLDHLEEQGLEHLQVFESVEQMLDYGRKLVQREGDDVLRAGLMFTGDGNNPIYWLSAIVDLGGRWFDNEKQAFSLQTPEAEQSLQFFYDILWKERLDDPALGDNSFNALSQGLASMAFMWPEYVPFAKESFPDVNLALTIKPGFQADKPAIFNHTDTWNLAAWSGTKNKEGLMDFLSFCKNRDVQMAMLEKNVGMSPLKEITFDPQLDFWITGAGSFMAPVFKAITQGQYRYFGPFGNMDTLEYDIMWPVMNKLLHKELGVSDTLAEMESALNAEMEKYQAKYPNLPPVEIHWDGIPSDLMVGIPNG